MDFNCCLFHADDLCFVFCLIRNCACLENIICGFDNKMCHENDNSLVPQLNILQIDMITTFRFFSITTLRYRTITNFQQCTARWPLGCSGSYIPCHVVNNFPWAWVHFFRSGIVLFTSNTRTFNLRKKLVCFNETIEIPVLMLPSWDRWF